MANQVNTVRGQVSADQLGKTMIHEHFQFGYPGFHGDITLGRYDRQEALRVGLEVAERLKAHGVQSVVDPTPNECGRDPLLLKEISEMSGLNIICATGYYYEGESATAYWKFRALLGDAESEIYEMYMKEITEGIGDTGIRAGVIKLASSKDVITDYEKMFFRAAARAQRDTGVTIVTHTQEGTMGPEQAELLISHGADPNRIVIGHMCGNTDVAYHLRTLDTGVSIGFDRFGLQGLAGTPLDRMRETVLIGLIGMGYADRILLSHDTVNCWLGRALAIPEPLLPTVVDWHPTHIFENVIPTLREAGISEETIHKILVDNPQRVFGA
ncbi:phosphotriesterase-related protein [Kyrpidia sp.]|uniref:phosphotriesterase family protein n=1 Tax=Kyrpidia sp. TaxID=2073077 RepID=UPI00258D72D0|nr:phosphotriesterase-related protein [Kyrpidia sp.]MCL6577022.1 phosphotriesterase-related protein [Kyrpidia sp.]